MKTLAQLIAELQKIPNPEKVAIAYLTDGFYTLADKDFDVSLDVLFESEQRECKEQGIKSLVTF